MDSITDFIAQFFPSKKIGTSMPLIADVQRALRQIFGNADAYVPMPKTMFVIQPQEDQLWGYPVIRNAKLVNALYAYLQQEIANQAAVLLKQKKKGDAIVGGREYELARNAYIEELQTTLDACVLNSLGQKFAEIFWLDHSLDVADAISKVRKKVIEIDPKLGQTDGEIIRYRVLARYLETADQALEKVLASLGSEFAGSANDYRSPLYKMMRDNVLIFSEVPTVLKLDDLEAFVAGYLGKDFEKFRKQVDKFRDTAAHLIKKDAVVRALVGDLWPSIENPEQARGDAYLLDQRFRRILFAHPKVSPKDFPADFQETLGVIATRLVQYDLIHYFRSLIKRCIKSKEYSGCYNLESDKNVVFDDATRPMNFAHPLVLDNFVRRFGLVYDITSFSQTYFEIKATTAGKERAAATQMFKFQEALNALPIRFQVRFEKFLGDGSFYSSRKARSLLECAVVIQETYARACSEGFPFNKGLRIALNWSYYYLLPLRTQTTKQGLSYDFFGPGLIELTRLTSGKTTKEVAEIKDLLVGHGYPVEVVHKFFSHIERVLGAEQSAANRKETENRKFYVLVDEKGNLVNEGIVATRQFIERLSEEVGNPELRLIRWRGRVMGGFVSPALERWVALREAGLVRLKGLDPFMAYEVMDFSKEDRQNGEFEEARPPEGKNLADLVLGEEQVGEEDGYLTAAGKPAPAAPAQQAHYAPPQAPPAQPPRPAETNNLTNLETSDMEILETIPLNPVPAAAAPERAPVPAPKPVLPPPPAQETSPGEITSPSVSIASAPAAAAPVGLDIACFVYEIEPGKGKYFVVGRFDRKRKVLENAVVEPKEVRITDRERIANIYRQLERQPGRAKERIDLTPYARAKDFKLIVLGP